MKRAGGCAISMYAYTTNAHTFCLRYNCSYLPVDSPRAFSEALFILMTGCGVGYSVERRYIKQLPPVPRMFSPGLRTVVVQDSAEGWANALLDVLEQLWAGVL